MKVYTHKGVDFQYINGLNIYLGNSIYPLKMQLNNGVLSWRLNRKIWMSINQLKNILKEVRKADDISFNKHKRYKELMEIVDKIEQDYNLYIIIKRREVIISIMKLTSHNTVVHIEGKSKQEAIWLAILKWYNKQN